jgi:spoIIIJ-associated protein
MKEKRATLEVIAPSVEEAIEKGLADLGLPEEAVEVEILDQGSRGLFGLGSRHARIRLAVKSAGEQESVAATPKPAAATPEKPQPSPKIEHKPVAQTPSEKQETRPTPTAAAVTIGEDIELQVAKDTVSELLDTMKVQASVSVRFGEADDQRSRVPILIDVRGDDLSILIGRRAGDPECSPIHLQPYRKQELGRPLSLVIDVEGYRARREGQIRQLARRMAEQAVKTAGDKFWNLCQQMSDGLFTWSLGKMRMS